jgi:hypothetical protein
MHVTCVFVRYGVGQKKEKATLLKRRTCSPRAQKRIGKDDRQEQLAS